MSDLRTQEAEFRARARANGKPPTESVLTDFQEIIAKPVRWAWFVSILQTCKEDQIPMGLESGMEEGGSSGRGGRRLASPRPSRLLQGLPSPRPSPASGRGGKIYKGGVAFLARSVR